MTLAEDVCDVSFYEGKRVLVTGHTGFKGSWLCRILANAGAEVTGFALEPPTEPSLFKVASIEGQVNSILGDVRDFQAVACAVSQSKPDIVFHLAAQPIVLDGYRDPRYTYETNVMGTVNLLEAVRNAGCVRSVVNVTTDKVYLNEERSDYGFVEDDPLDGYDPYSNSKSCSELVTHSYRNSYFNAQGVAVSTARAGNVIGGGDFAPNRIIPDCVRAVAAGEALVVRNPYSTRPYQHVLEPLFAYLLLARKQYEHPACQGAYNIGPDDCDCVSTGELVRLFSAAWGEGFEWEEMPVDPQALHEASFLKLDSSKFKQAFGWQPRWRIGRAVEETAKWARAYMSGDAIGAVMDEQIAQYKDSVNR